MANVDPRIEPAAGQNAPGDIGPVTDGLVDQLTAIAWQAAAAILKVDPAASDHHLKSDKSPVCRADILAEAAIVDGLSRVLPGLPIVSEEAVACPRPAALGTTFALIDPLDGTREFLAGRPEFTVNLAIVVDSVPVVGVVAAPAQRTIWRGVVGQCAERLTVLPLEGGAHKVCENIRISTRRWPSAGVVVAVSRSHFDDRTAAFLSHFVIAQRIDCGSSVKFCRIAEGAADLYPRLAPICEWDIAAGHAVLAAAGGTVVDPEGSRIVYGGESNAFRLRGCIALGDPSAVSRIAETGRHLA